MAKYRNPWHRQGAAHYGPEFFETDVRPIAHAGCLIYQTIKGKVWDVVRDDVCLTQRAGINGAKQAAEEFSRRALSRALGKE